MRIVMMLLAGVLVLFGGGCTVVVMGLGLSDPGSIGAELGLLLGILVPFGLLPLAGGYFVFKAANRMKKPPPDLPRNRGDS